VKYLVGAGLPAMRLQRQSEQFQENSNGSS